VDVSARTLVTELAPWPSLVQRFWRCNRYGESHEARVFWTDIMTGDDHEDLALPYGQDDLMTARTALESLVDAAPENLKQVSVAVPGVIRPVLRRKDLLAAFSRMCHFVSSPSCVAARPVCEFASRQLFTSRASSSQAREPSYPTGR
jgi:hypothetical protein